MMAFGGQAWSGFWDPVQYTRVVFFFLFFFFGHFFSLALLLAFLPFCLPFSSRFSSSVSSGLVLQSCLLFPHCLYRSFVIVTPSYTSFNALLLYLTPTMTGWKAWSIIAVESCFQYLILFFSCWPLPTRDLSLDFGYWAFSASYFWSKNFLSHSI